MTYTILSTLLAGAAVTALLFAAAVTGPPATYDRARAGWGGPRAAGASDSTPRHSPTLAYIHRELFADPVAHRGRR